MPPVPANVDYTAAYYHAAFMGDQLNTYGGKVSPIAMPNVLPAAGTITMLNDATRAPDALRKLWQNSPSPTRLGLCGTTTASLVLQLDTAVNINAFSVGQQVDVRTTSTGNLITNGSGRTIQSIDTGAKTITLDAAGGNITTSATMSVYLFVGSAAMQSWTASTAGFSSGTDPAGYVAVANGAAPTSSVLQYQRIQTTLTAQAAGNGPGLASLYSGTLWISAPIFVGTSIASWRSFLDSLTTPAGVDQAIKIRGATTSASPAEADWSAFAAIVNGNNIGTILSDTTTPPADRWIQLKVEQGPSATGTLPVVLSLVAQWVIGSATILPLVGILHKKRYLICAASSTATANDTVIVNDRNDAWMKYAGWQLNGMVHFAGNFIGFSSVDAKILHLDVDGLYSDQNAAIDAYLVTRLETMDDPHIRKNFRYGYIHFGPVASTLLVSYQRPGDADFTAPITLAFTGDGQSKRQSFAPATIGRGIQRKYRNNTINENMLLRGETIYYDRRPLQP